MGCVFVGDVAVTLSLSGNLNVIESLLKPLPETLLETAWFVRVTPNPSARSWCASPTRVTCSRLRSTPSEEARRSFDGATVMGASRPWARARPWSSARACAGKYLLTAGLDDFIRVASIETVSYLPDLEGSRVKLQSQPRSMGVDDAGSLVAVAMGDGVAAYDFDGTLGTLGTVAATAAVGAGSGGKGEPSSVCVRGDGREIAVGCKDGAVRLFSVVAKDVGVGSESAQPFSLVPGAVMTRHRGEVTGCAYSPDGTRLATCDAKPRGARLGSNRRRRRFRQDGVPQGEGDVLGVERGRREARAPARLTGQIIVWDTTKPPLEGRCAVDGAHVGGVTCLEWRDTNTVVTGGFDACVRTWTLP